MTHPRTRTDTYKIKHAHQNREARHRFALLKVANSVTRQSAALLHTIIPKNVLAKLATLQPGECLNTEISQGTIMFCKLIIPGGGGEGSDDGDGVDWEGEGGAEEVGSGVARVEKAAKAGNKHAVKHLAEIEKALEPVVKKWKKTGAFKLDTL